MPIYISCPAARKSVMDALTGNNIQSRRYFTPSLDIAYPQLRSFGCENSQKLAGGVICLPLHFYMIDKDVLSVTNIIKETLKRAYSL